MARDRLWPGTGYGQMGTGYGQMGTGYGQYGLIVASTAQFLIATGLIVAPGLIVPHSLISSLRACTLSLPCTSAACGMYTGDRR